MDEKKNEEKKGLTPDEVRDMALVLLLKAHAERVAGHNSTEADAALEYAAAIEAA